MRRRWMMGLGAAAVLGAVLLLWWWVRPGGPSKAAGALPRENVTAVLFLDEPAGLLRAIEGRFVAKEAGAFDLGKAIEAIGFDPRESADWQGVGIDHAKGIAAVLFGPTGATPIVLVDIENTDLFFEWLARALNVGSITTRPPKDGVQIVEAGRTRLLMGRRGPFTAIMRGGAGRDAGFRAFLQADGRLGADARIRELFRAAERRPRLVAFAQTAQLARDQTAQPLGMLVEAAPTLSGYIDETSGAVWIALSEGGRAQLNTYATASGPPPRFSRLLPAKGWSALRLSLNLDAVRQLIALYRQLDGQRLHASGWWPVIEVALQVHEQVGSALSGHLVIAMPNESLAEWLAQPERVSPRWVVMAGLRPDARLPKTGLTIAARQVGQIALLAPDAEVLSTLRPLADSTIPSQNRLLDGGILFGMTIETSDLLDALSSAVPRSVFDILKSTELANKPRLAMGFALEPIGLVSRGDAGPLFATAGLAGLIVAPELARRRRGRQHAEARRFVTRIAEGAVDAWRARIPGIDGSALPPRFPPSAGPTPPTQAGLCDGFEVAPSAWDTPGWQGLNFAIHGTHRYQYSFEVDPAGQGFTARAIGDLDCDGTFSTFEVIGEVRGEDVLLRSVAKAPLE